MGMMNKKTFIIIMFVAMAIGIYISQSYAFFGASIDVSLTTLKNITVSNSNTYKLDYIGQDGKFDFKKDTFMPSDTISRKVLITNVTSSNQTIKVKFASVTNTFGIASDLQYSATCSPYVNYYESTTSVNTSCSEVSSSGNAPTASPTDIYTTTIKPGQSHLITVTLTVDALWSSNSIDGFLGYIIVAT